MIPVFKEGSLRGIGFVSRLLCHRCHRLDLIYKVIYLIVFNSRNELLIQIRGDCRDDVSVGGHVSVSDKSDIEALIREDTEELEITFKKKREE